ncbi:MAG: hypothetical protein HYS13_22760 [Planctomycetia bacterium]|nr:hypothetical protein [Planctomycetia bacterium]
MTNRVLRGVVHGKTIELRDDAGISDGQEVEIVVRRLLPKDRKPGEGFLRTAGALADYEEWDKIMDEIQQSRKMERRSQWSDQ